MAATAARPDSSPRQNGVDRGQTVPLRAWPVTHMSYCASDTVARALVDHRHRPSVMAPRAEVHRCTLETQSVSFSSRLIEGLFSVSTKSALNWTIVPLLGLTCTGPRFGAVLIVAVVVGVISPTVDLTPVIDCRHRQKQPNNS